MKNFLSGFIAGLCFANSFFVFDMFKTRAQMRKDSNISYRYEVMNILKTEGVRGFTRGWLAMILRDGPGFGFYF